MQENGKSVKKPIPSFFDVSPSFWQEFVDLYWNQKPVVLKNPFAGSIASIAELFNGITRASDSYRQREGNASPRLYIDNARVMSDIDDFLPKNVDGSLSDYIQRVGKQLNGRQFGLILNEYHNWDADNWLRARDFFSGLFERTGIPAGGAATDIFLGTYDRTPFGIHKDSKHVFTWVVGDPKRMLLWPFEVFRDHLPSSALSGQSEVSIGSGSYAPYRDSAIVLEGKRGDLMYWPPSYWHIAEAISGTSSCMTLTFSVEDFQNPLLTTLSRMEEMIKISRGKQKAKNSWHEFSRSQPPDGRYRPSSIDTSSRVAIESLLNSEAFEFENRTASMEWISGLGFKGFPSNWPVLDELDDDDMVYADIRYPILWSANGDTLACSANGHGWSMRKTRDSMRALDYLASGPRGKVGELQQNISIKDHVAFRQLLNLLYNYRWLVKDTAESHQKDSI